MGKLSGRKVETAKVGMHGDGNGLWLRVRPGGRKTWTYRYSLGGRAREMGLGDFPRVSLANAREAAAAARKLAKGGSDPITARRSGSQGQARTFAATVEAFVAERGIGGNSAQHKREWLHSLKVYVLPRLAEIPVAAITTQDVTAALAPIWRTKFATASRVRQRIETVFDFARTHQWRTGENPARWRGHLEHVLSRQKAIVKHHAALDWREVADFMRELRRVDTMAARCLEFAVLTAARRGEAIGAVWDEIDLGAACWVVPAARMKAAREHRVPLSRQALAVLDAVRPVAADASSFVFPGRRRGASLSPGVLLKLLRGRLGRDATAHGFRSAFRDWAAETGQASDAAEVALAHSVGSAVVKAYARGDLFERRRSLMQAWADYSDTPRFDA